MSLLSKITNSSDTTADILVDKLIAWGVEMIFTLVGDGVNPIFESLRKKQSAIKIITVRHEEAAAFMASGYAKCTGKLGVCLGTSGPGAVHLMNGLYDAAMEQTPVLAITGSVNHDVAGTQHMQEVNSIAMLSDIAIFNQTITGPLQAQTVVDLACRAALATPGVAHLTLATDTQQKKLDDDKRSQKGGHLTGSSAYTPRIDTAPQQEIAKAAALLNKSNKIMILAGRGALDAKVELKQLAQKLAAPVAKALLGKMLMDDDDEYTTGGIGRLGTLASKQMMDDCEVLLMLGSNMPYLEYYPEENKATAIQIDRDATRIGLRYPIEIGLHGDVKPTLQALLQQVETHTDKSFLELAQKRMADWNEKINGLETAATTPIQPQYLAAQVGGLLKADAVLAIDTGAHTVFTARHIKAKSTQQLIVCGNLASMGPGLPYAIAAQLAYPNRQVVAMVGDGGLTMLMGELATAVLYNLPIKVVVFKNNALALDGFEQEEIGGKQYGISLYPISFVKIAEACGAEGYHCSSPQELPGILATAFASTKPCVIEVDVDRDASPAPPEKL